MKTTMNITALAGIFFAACLAFFSTSAFAGVAGYAQFVSSQVQENNSAGQMRTPHK